LSEADGIGSSALDLLSGNIEGEMFLLDFNFPSTFASIIVTFLSLGSPLVKNLTVAILQLSESGELTYLRDKWWPSSCVGVQDAHSANTLGLPNLHGLFLLLGLGLGLGLLVALLELVSKARVLAKDGKVMESVLRGDTFQVQKEMPEITATHDLKGHDKPFQNVSYGVPKSCPFCLFQKKMYGETNNCFTLFDLCHELHTPLHIFVNLKDKR